MKNKLFEHNFILVNILMKMHLTKLFYLVKNTKRMFAASPKFIVGILLFLFVFSQSVLGQCTSNDSVFISEIHYDNSGSDVNEGVEITGPAGTDLSCYVVYLYNGSNGASYGTISFSGTIDDEGCGYGSVWEGYSGIQNGSPDGMALVNTCTNTVIMFISYEGTFTAANGPANGLTSTNIGVTENSSTGTNESLQLSGSGYCYSSIVSSGGWQSPATNTRDNINSGLTDMTNCSVPVDHLEFSFPTACYEPGENITFDVCAVDASNNVITSYNQDITITKGSGPGNMTPASSTVTATNGCATFTVSFDAVGNYTISASDASSNSGTGSITINSSCIDHLEFVGPSNCVEINQNTNFSVCAVDAYGVVRTNYNGTITVAKNSGPGNMTPLPATATAINGCATFTVSFDATGSYVLDATDGTYTGTSNSFEVKTVCNTCPVVHRHLVDACGGTAEGINEYLVIKNGSSDITVDDISVDFPNGGTFCNSGCGTQTWVSNTTFVNQLNSTAGCSPPLFIDAIDNGGNIPANATIVVFTGANPTYAFDFSSECGNGPYYAIFANNTDTPGRYKNYISDCSLYRTTTIQIGSCASDSYTYQPCMLTGGDGAMVMYDENGNPVYTNDPSCSVILPLELKYFEASVDYNKNVILYWEIDGEPINLTLNKIENDNEVHLAYNLTASGKYVYSDGIDEILKFQLAWEDLEGNKKYSNIVEISPQDIGYEYLTIHPNPVSDYANIEGYLNNAYKFTIINIQGQILKSGVVKNIKELNTLFNSSINKLPKGVYFLHLDNMRLKFIKI